MNNAEIKKIQERISELEPQLSDPALFSNPKKLQELNKEYARLKETADLAEKIEKLDAEMKELREAEDPDLRQMAYEELPVLEAQRAQLLSNLEERLAPKDPLDEKNIIIEIRAGTGGDEAALFAANLFRMYSRFAERQNWKTKIISSNRTDIGGFKEIIFEIASATAGQAGAGAYSWLKYESGTHRVQRVPETEKNGRIHTSTATVAVMPAVDEVDFEINPQDLKIETSTSRGHGGQSVNTTYSAIRITHIPTGIVTICQDERSQQQNKAKAMEVMRARLFALEQEKRKKEETELRRSQIGTGERSEKIRTYNYPQDRLTDHRVKDSWHNLPKILDGDIAPVMEKLRAAGADKLQADDSD